MEVLEQLQVVVGGISSVAPLVVVVVAAVLFDPFLSIPLKTIPFLPTYAISFPSICLSSLFIM